VGCVYYSKIIGIAEDEINRLKIKSLDDFLEVYDSLKDRNAKILEAIDDGGINRVN